MIELPTPKPTPVEEALLDATVELQVARQHGSRSDLAFALRRLGGLSASRLHVERALACLLEARSISVADADRFGTAAADDVMAMLLCHLGRPAEAATLHLAAADEFRALDAPDDEAIARSWGWWALLEAGRATDALHQARLAVELDPTVANLAGLAAPLADLGRLDEAERCLAALPEDHQEVTAWGARLCGHVAARRNDPDLAESMFSWALEMLEEEGDLAEVRCCVRQMQRVGVEPQPHPRHAVPIAITRRAEARPSAPVRGRLRLGGGS